MYNYYQKKSTSAATNQQSMLCFFFFIPQPYIFSLVADATNVQMKTPAVSLHHSESSAPSHLTIESAGFQQCVVQLASYMHKITPAQRTSLIEGLKHHTESQQPNDTSSGQHSSSSVTDSSQRRTEMPDAASAEVTSESKEESRRPLFLSHSLPQPQSCSTPCHDTLSPPTSPWFSPSFSTYATSPPFPSFACHFSFPSCLSPPSSNTSFSTLPQSLHTLPAPVGFSPRVAHFPPLTTLRSPPHPTQSEGSSVPSLMWRPWFWRWSRDWQSKKSSAL